MTLESLNLANLDPCSDHRVGLIGGSNFQQTELHIRQWYPNQPNFLRPTYVVTSLDSNASWLFGELGAVGSGRFNLSPKKVCRLFDVLPNGFYLWRVLRHVGD